MQNESILTEKIVFIYNPDVTTTTTSTTTLFPPVTTTTTTNTTTTLHPVTTTTTTSTTTSSYPLAYNVSGFGSSIINGCYVFWQLSNQDEYWYKRYNASSNVTYLRGIYGGGGWWLQLGGHSHYYTSSPTPTTGWYVWGSGVEPIGTVVATTGCS